MVILWLIIALAAGIVEAITVSLVSVWFAIGAVFSAISAGVGASVTVQIIVFLVSSLILMLLTAPLCKRFRLTAKSPTNADRLIGCVGIVTEAIDPLISKGEVRIKGQSWSAQARGDGYVSEGTRVVVEDIVGAHLVVSIENKESEE